MLRQSQIAVANGPNGLFAFQGCGVACIVLAAARSRAYRVWAPARAEIAEPGVLVAGGTGPGRTISDNYYGDNYYCDNYTCYDNLLSRVKFWLSNPWVVAGIVATAVAVPVGIHNADRGGKPVSP